MSDVVSSGVGGVSVSISAASFLRLGVPPPLDEDEAALAALAAAAPLPEDAAKLKTFRSGRRGSFETEPLLLLPLPELGLLDPLADTEGGC